MFLTLVFFYISQGKTDAWSQYMSEVKKYKERLGDEGDIALYSLIYTNS